MGAHSRVWIQCTSNLFWNNSSKIERSLEMKIHYSNVMLLTGNILAARKMLRYRPGIFIINIVNSLMLYVCTKLPTQRGSVDVTRDAVLFLKLSFLPRQNGDKRSLEVLRESSIIYHDFLSYACA